jgi:hypothetical protein
MRVQGKEATMRSVAGAVVILAGAVLLGAAAIGESLIVAGGKSAWNVNRFGLISGIGGIGLIVAGFLRVFFARNTDQARSDHDSPTDVSTRS